ncbi:hypothetical protein JCM8547_004376 [Rhodosporidiobolus lusitaniae]
MYPHPHFAGLYGFAPVVNPHQQQQILHPPVIPHPPLPPPQNPHAFPLLSPPVYPNIPLPPVPVPPPPPVLVKEEAFNAPLPAPHAPTESPASVSTSTPDAPPPKPPVASTSKTPFVRPPTPPSLSDPLALLLRSREGLAKLVEQGNVDARPSRQGPPPAPKSGACSACRAAKAKCSQDEPSCVRCLQNKVPCEYPVFQKRGRKRLLTPNQVLLGHIHQDIEKAFSLLETRLSSLPESTPQQPPSHPTVQALQTPRPSSSSRSPSLADASSLSAVQEEDDEQSRHLKSVIESPLAVLAHISSLKVSESTEEESGKTFRRGEAAPAQAEGYFATGLYQLRSDAAEGLDPVSMAFVTEGEFERLVDLYFTHLHPFFFHLSPSLHKPHFMRNVSPFLSTTIAYISSTFDQQTQHLIPALHDHVHRLSNRVWAEGLKSLEICQAYLLLIHWTPIEDDWGDDRRWGWLGAAVRIATEIKLHKTLNTATYDFYRSVTPLGEGAYDALSATREWSWKLIFVTEVALCVSTGRTGSIQSLSASSLGSLLPSTLPPSDPLYNVTALIHLNRLYAKAHTHSNSLQDSESGHEPELRGVFKEAWEGDLRGWYERWPSISPLIRLIAQHNTTILLSISLRFKGPVAPVLEDCRKSAVETAKIAVGWRDPLPIGFASNLVVVNIAYAATLLLRITAAKGPIDGETRLLCAAVADVLIRIGSMRPATRNLATLHGTRIRALLSADLPKHAASAAAAVPSSAVSTFPHHATLTSPSASTSVLSPTHVIAPLPPTSTSAADAIRFPSLHPEHQQSSAAAATNLDTSPYPSMPSLFDLPPTSSHMLWDLFNESDPPHHLASASSTSGAAAGDAGGGGGGGEEGGAQGGGKPADAWVWKTSNDQDWLNSEPGAWAW